MRGAVAVKTLPRGKQQKTRMVECLCQKSHKAEMAAGPEERAKTDMKS